VLSLDDDSYPLERDALGRILALFRRRPGLAVVTFPQITDEFPESFTQIKAQRGERAYVGSFTNSGASIRREIYARLPGYPGFFHHAYEEPDFALQCIAAGYGVAVDPSVTIRHHYSRVARNEIRTHQLHARNEMWSILMRCPWPLLPAVAFFRLFRQFFYACGRGLRWVVREPVWWWECAGGLVSCWKQRRPVRWRAYWKWLWRVRQPEAF
jgi:GT2 family glycosyltransferase